MTAQKKHAEHNRAIQDLKEAILKNDVKALEAASDVDLLSLEMRSLVNDDLKPSHNLGLVRLAIKNQAVGIIDSLLNRESWVVSHCRSTDEEAKLKLYGLRYSISEEEEVGLKYFMDHVDYGPWHAFVGSVGSGEGVGKKVWNKGLSLALKEVLKKPTLGAAEQKLIGEAFTAAIENSERSSKENFHKLQETLLLCAESFLSKDFSVKAALVVVQMATEPSKVQRRAWEWVKKAQELGVIAWDKIPKECYKDSMMHNQSQFVLKTNGYSSPNRTEAQLPPCVDIAWFTAMMASSDESIQIAREMALVRPFDDKTIPKVSIKVGNSVKHPLQPVWEMWNNSKKAGFALPKKAIQNAEKMYLDALNTSKHLLLSSTVEMWQKTAAEVFKDLYAGKVADKFPGGLEKPSFSNLTEQDNNLAPSLWRYFRENRNHYSRNADKDYLAKTVVATDPKCLSVKNSIEQFEFIAGSGMVKEKDIAKIEQEVLTRDLAEIFAKGEPLKKGSGSRRL